MISSIRHIWFSLLWISSMLLSWCTALSKPLTLQTQDNLPINWEQRRVSFKLYTDTPITPESLTTHIGYGCLQGKNLIWTAKHLIPNELKRLSIQNTSWLSCPIKHIWHHPLYDISVIETTSSCWWWNEYSWASWIWSFSEVLYLDWLLKKWTLFVPKYWSSLGYLSGSFTSGMSWNPLFLADGNCIGVISSQTFSWYAEVVVFHDAAQSRKNIIP